MRNILTRANLRVLRRFASSRVLLAFDFDGTLAPIVAEPDRAAMRPATRQLLARAASRYPCVVITGRARADALRRLGGVGVTEVIGNHGIEAWQAPARGLLAVQRWRPALLRHLAAVPGIVIEDKTFSVTVHYRRARDKKRARAAILRAASSLTGARMVPGKLVMNLLPSGSPDKGTALRKARTHCGCDAAVFVGDDTTDEDVFALLPADWLLTIRVGRRRGSLASFYIRDQRAIDDLLRALLDAEPLQDPP
jgi:trehalose 6-phosphate phosphatase